MSTRIQQSLKKSRPPEDTTDGPDPIDIHVGKRLRQRRMLVGMSQERLGEAVGLTFQQIQKYERGTNRMGASRIFRFAEILSVPVAYFFEEGALGARGNTGLAESKQQKLDDEEGLPNDLLQRRETLDLVRAYYKINDVKQRRKFLELVKAMATATMASD
ncbi:MAG: helix-turn-helix transcriptional regulator [Alphaproteobacteria bacterium]|nr:helix-turn-helix transcriptional regulator [Alphaproteobacteria bacterium]